MTEGGVVKTEGGVVMTGGGVVMTGVGHGYYRRRCGYDW